jgi:outer membrane protein TolC
LDVSFGMTLWQAGRRERVDESRAALRAAGFGHATTVQALVQQVAEDYYAVLAAQQLVEVAEAGVESAEGHVDEVRALIGAGAAAEVDVFVAEDDLARAQLDLIDARSGVRRIRAALKNSMGVSPAADFELAESPPLGDEDDPSLEDAIATALESRAELSADRASVDASRYALAQAEIERGPVTSVMAGYDERYADWSDRSYGWEALVTVSWPLLDGGAAKAAAAQAGARLKASEADLKARTDQVELEVDLALVEVQRTRERVTATEVSVAAAEARLAAAEGKYQNAVAILLEVIDARVAVTNARANQVRARYEYQTAWVALQRALGILAAPDAGEPEGVPSD